MDEAGENRKKTQPLMTNVQLIMQVFEEIIQINGHCYPIVCFFGCMESSNCLPASSDSDLREGNSCLLQHTCNYWQTSVQLHSFSMTKNCHTWKPTRPASFSNSLAFFDTWYPHSQRQRLNGDYSYSLPLDLVSSARSRNDAGQRR